MTNQPEPDSAEATCEVVAISGVFQKADGKPFTDERGKLFIEGLLKWVRDEGFAYGGTYGLIHNDEDHEAFTQHERHRADHLAAAWAVKTRDALEANVRIQHLRTFPHVKPTEYESRLLALLSTFPTEQDTERKSTPANG